MTQLLTIPLSAFVFKRLIREKIGLL